MSNEINNLAVVQELVRLAPPEKLEKQECKHLHMVRGGTGITHVLFIIDELCEMGGAERVLLKIIARLPQKRFRVSLITFRKGDSIAELSTISCPVYVLPLKKTYDRNGLRTAAAIRKFIREQQVAIVHTFFETSDIWGGLIAKLSGCPVLISSRRDLGILRARKHKIAYRIIGRFYESVLAVSPQVKQYCVEHDGIAEAKVRILFNGLDMDNVRKAKNRAEMRQSMAINQDVPVIITVANIKPVKGIDVLVLAAAEVCRKYPQALFLVAGKKTDHQHCRELEEKITDLGLASNFRFLGSHEDPFSLLRMSDVFCLPSRSEGFSNALIEAMACRLPCVATDVGGNCEALEHQRTGFLVASEDHREMAIALLKLLDDRELAARMGRKGEEVVLRRFTVETMMTDLIAHYEALLQAKVGRL